MEERKRCLKSLEEFERRTKPKHTFEVKSGVGTPISEILEIEERESDGIELSTLEKETLETFRKKIDFVMPSFNAALGLLSDPETRTPEEYEEEVTNYLDMASEVLRDRVRQEYLRHDGGSLGLSLKNLTDRPFGRVKVEVSFPNGVEVLLDFPDSEDLAELPQRPHPYGERKVRSLTPDWNKLSLLSPQIPRLVVPNIERSEVLQFRGAKKVSFRSIDLRPSEEIQLPLVSVIDSKGSDGRLVFAWEATAIDAKGRIGSSLEVKFEQSDALTEVMSGSLRRFVNEDRTVE